MNSDLSSYRCALLKVLVSTEVGTQSRECAKDFAPRSDNSTPTGLPSQYNWVCFGKMRGLRAFFGVYTEDSCFSGYLLESLAKATPQYSNQSVKTTPHGGKWGGKVDSCK